MFKNPDSDFAPEILAGLKIVGTPTATHYLMGCGYDNTYLIGVPPQAPSTGQVLVGRKRFSRLKLAEGHSLPNASPAREEYLEWRRGQPEFAQYPFSFT